MNMEAWFDGLAAFDWSDLVRTMLGAGIGSAIVGGLFSWVRDRRERQGQKTHIALRIADLLEGYARECDHNLAMYSTYVSSRGTAGWAPGQVADAPALPGPDDTGWLVLDQNLAIQARAFRHEVDDSIRRMKDVAQIIVLPDERASFAAEEHALIGWQAIVLARQLRANRWRRSKPDSLELRLRAEVERVSRRRASDQ